MMRVIRWILGGLGVIVALVLFLDTFGGYLMDGPLGPIPGGEMSGPVVTDADPDGNAGQASGNHDTPQVTRLAGYERTRNGYASARSGEFIQGGESTVA